MSSFRATVAVLATGLVATFFPIDADSATSCGGKGQRACCVLERLDPCDGNLRQQLPCTGNCDCGKGPGSSLGMCVDLNAPCGGKGGVPCPLEVMIRNQRRACDAGLIQDFLNHKCVDATAALKEANCRAVVGAFKQGKVPDAFKPMIEEAKKRAARVSKGDAMKKAQDFIQPLKPLIPELERIHAETAKLKDLFEPDTFCVPPRLQSRLNQSSPALKPNVRGVLPGQSGKFHMTYALNVSGALLLGGQAVLGIATDYSGGTAVYVAVGPAIVSNLSVGGTVGVQFYPNVTLDSFDGWGYGVAMTAGVPLKIVGGGVDVPLNDRLLAVGIGVSGGVGAGFAPVDVGLSAQHTWQLWSTR